MTAAGVKETLLENQQSFIVGKMDMKGKQKHPPFSGRFSLLLSLSTGCSNARFCNDRAKIRRSEFVISHVLDEFSEVVGDEDAFLPQQAKLVADPWLDRNLHDVFRKGHCRVEEGTTVAGRKTVEDCRQLAAVHFDMRSCSFGTEAGDDGVRLDGVRVEKNDRLFLQCFEGNGWFLSQVMILVYTVHVRIFNDGVVIVVIQIVEIQIGDSHIQFIIIDELAGVHGRAFHELHGDAVFLFKLYGKGRQKQGARGRSDADPKRCLVRVLVREIRVHLMRSVKDIFGFLIEKRAVIGQCDPVLAMGEKSKVKLLFQITDRSRYCRL